MATTTYHDITLPGSGSQDWVTMLNRALSAITEKMVRQQLPTGTTLRWGDIAGGNYLEVSTSGVRVIGGLDHGTSPARNLRLPQGDAFPTDFGEGSIFLRTDTNVLYARVSAAWVEIGALDEAAVAAAGGLLITDLGADKGSFAVSDGAGGIETAQPGADDTFLVSKAAEANGWNLDTVLGLLGRVLTKGQIPAGLAGDLAAAFAPGANGTILVPDSGEAAGLRWATLTSLLGVLLVSRGQLIAGGAAGPVVVPVAAANTYVPVSDSAEASGIKWIPQTELGVVPNARTRVGADLYLYANYI